MVLPTRHESCSAAGHATEASCITCQANDDGGCTQRVVQWRMLDAAMYAEALPSKPDTLIALALAMSIRRGHDRAMRWPDFADVSSILAEVYAQHDWTLLWSQNGQPTATARLLVHAIDSAVTRGLDASDFDSHRLNALLDSGLDAPARQVAFDVTLSVAAARLMRSLRVGRVDPVEVHAHLRLPRDVVDLCADVAALIRSTDPRALLDAAEPPYVHYGLLKRALRGVRARAITDTAARAQIAKIELTLERWRWLPHQFPTAPIFVNIPAFRLYALSPNSDREADMLRMNVVVGSAYSHRTPVFSDALEYIVFAPYWDVPPSIATAELLPLARRDPHLLTVNHYQIVNSAGSVLAPTAAALRAVSAGTARIRQLPGGSNALGLVKFVFPNQFNVYLHDTPVQSAFTRDRRDLSHGCVRVANPVALAQWLLRDVAGWDSTAIAAAMRRKAPYRVDLAKPVPVHIIYATAIAREDGTVLFHDDIYGLDAELAVQLRRGFPYRVPAH